MAMADLQEKVTDPAVIARLILDEIVASNDAYVPWPN